MSTGTILGHTPILSSSPELDHSVDRNSIGIPYNKLKANLGETSFGPTSHSVSSSLIALPHVDLLGTQCEKNAQDVTRPHVGSSSSSSPIADVSRGRATTTKRQRVDALGLITSKSPKQIVQDQVA
jgi:hypothetical protein